MERDLNMKLHELNDFSVGKYAYVINICANLYITIIKVILF